ncbi:MAG: tRNA preQ1(34) S-adenosylmethionine ribosyltransferase-isomerase QueA [Mariprofundaceae bacterium]|nr:tRNA preQ1(34) S-adenosylmethionine ribosyltransferase-isomerase QueA [Mariprofundaceae bacterium]
MQLTDFDYALPEHLIAGHPLPERDASRLLDIQSDPFLDRHIADLPQLVQPGDLWVLNDTRVIPARLLGKKQSGGKVELLLLEPTAESNEWLAWGKANKPLKPGEIITITDDFSAEILQRDGKEVRVRLMAEDVMQAIEANGHIPLPPYIDRVDTEMDKERYQTVFANKPGAVAAPTAGLHLTEALMKEMQRAGATFVHVTLHVGPGTFQPVQVETIHEHVMHEEAYHISDSAAEQVNRAGREGRRVVAVGTTSLRTLEAASDGRGVKAGSGRTDIFIYPGYEFRVVDALLTNFHLPKSTLLMLVSALAGHRRMMAAYEYAIGQEYRFYSYGDAMFIRRMSREMGKESQ